MSVLSSISREHLGYPFMLRQGQFAYSRDALMLFVGAASRSPEGSKYLHSELGGGDGPDGDKER